MGKESSKKSFILRSFWDLFLNDLANLLAGKLIMAMLLLSIFLLGSLLWLLRLFSIPISGTPAYVFLLIALTFLIIGLSIRKFQEWNARIKWDGVKEVAGFMWQFEYGHLQDGPFCVHCKEEIQQQEMDLDQRFMNIMMTRDSTIQHSCGKFIPQIEDVNDLRKNVAAYVLMCISHGESKVQEILST